MHISKREEPGSMHIGGGKEPGSMHIKAEEDLGRMVFWGRGVVWGVCISIFICILKERKPGIMHNRQFEGV